MVNGVLHRVVHARLQAANLLPVASFGEGEESTASYPPPVHVPIPLQSQHMDRKSSARAPCTRSFFHGSQPDRFLGVHVGAARHASFRIPARFTDRPQR